MITSDQGPHFAGAWFRGMCACLGIRQAFSQAYRSQANGRAERAGRQIMEWLAKLQGEGEVGWVEALPVMLRQYHDAVGESGYSPYEIVFGRFRNLPGIPVSPPEKCDDVLIFMQRQARGAEHEARRGDRTHKPEASSPGPV